MIVNAGKRGNPGVQLSMPDIDSVNLACATIDKDLRESACRRTDVGGNPGWLQVEHIQSMNQFQCCPADPWDRIGDQRDLAFDRRGHAIHDLSGNRDGSRPNHRLGA